jgi:glycosyltransferase involved in cell wall biosynthesis
MNKLYTFLLLISVYFIKFIIWIFTNTYFKKNSNINKNTILFLENFPIENSGYQYRAAKWANLLQENGYIVDILTTNKHISQYDFKLMNHKFFLLRNMYIRFLHCLQARKYSVVIVRRELLLYNDYGNLFMEKFLLKINSNVILDFDDDISAAKNEPKKTNSIFGKIMMQNGNKFNESLRLYSMFIVATNYLKEKVLLENKNIKNSDVIVIPTCVDYNKYTNKTYSNKIINPIFGWIGGSQNYKYIDMLLPIFNKLSNKFSFKLLVIGGEKYIRNTNFEILFTPWSLDTEINNLYKIDIGLMPLIEDKVSKGKGGFKLIQYMGLGIVSIASAITINEEIVDDGVNSFLASDSNSWEVILTNILENKYDIRNAAIKARQKILDNYTFDSNKKKYIEFINMLLNNKN